jgi:F-type H+-transporting ATPase subunit gamma
MGAQIRVLRRRIKTVQSTKKITKAMELIATSRIAKAQQRVAASKPYAAEITRVLTALASNTTTIDHPLVVERPQPGRVGVLVITSDRGLAGGYSANALKTAEELMARLRSEGKTPVLYVIGRKGVTYYRFRGREIEASWTGFSEQPTFADARNVGDLLVQTFLAGAEETVDSEDHEHGPDDIQGVDELHIVYTRFVSMISQAATARQFAPLEVTEAAPEGPQPAYEFEPEPEALLGALLPKYVNTRIYAALLESAASESAARRQAMKSATDNANELVKMLTRQANQARQGEITQEISEIVGGANALAAAGSDD